MSSVLNRFVRSLVRVAPLCLAAAMWSAGGASAADLSGMTYQPAPVQTTPTLPYDRFEIRFGALAHGVGGREQGSVDINGEFVTPRLPLGVSGWASYLVPRIHVGGEANLNGRTSFAYTGALWTWPIWGGVSLEAFVGPAVHNGSLVPGPKQGGLGCPVLFHAGASVSYQITDHWSVIGTFSHLSNGRELFGISCGSNQGTGGNQGLNNYGLKIGYSF
jgi:lipid A 3-O-deacylase